MDLEKRIELITREPIEEVITVEDLRSLLQTKSKVTAYDGFEPSGLLHLASGVMRAEKINDLQKAGVEFTLLVADWHAALNDKFGGDMKLIKTAGEYMIEGWKACGVDTKKVKMLWASDLVEEAGYWEGVMRFALNTSLKRAIRTAPIMGREEEEELLTSQVLYPFMQAYDPFHMKIDILQLGMDQRKVTMLSREMAKKMNLPKPVVLHHHLLVGLQGIEVGRMGQEDTESGVDAKMSKSKPTSCIFIHDSTEEIKKKLKTAFCPAKVVEGNPILEMWRYIIFRKIEGYTIKRPVKFGGNLEIQDYGELEKVYVAGKLHPLDLKNATAEVLDDILAPVRKHFEKGKAKELYEAVRKAKEQPVEAEKPVGKKVVAGYSKGELKNIAEVEKKIKENGVKAAVIKHIETPVTSMKTHLKLFNCTPAEVLKCLCMVSGGKPLVVVASGDVRIDTKKLEKVSKLKNIRMASLDELKKLFGKNPGEVDAITIPAKIPVFVDEKLLEKKEVIGSAGSARAGLKIKPKDILKCVDAKVVDLAK